MACAKCGADNGHFYDCPESRFARLEPANAPPAELAAPRAASAAQPWAIPVALTVTALFNQTALGSFVTRLCFTMPLHELGHAVASWVTGAWAIPLVWFTPMGETRSALVIVLELAALGGWALHTHRTARAWWPVATVAALFVVGLLVPSPARLALVTFAGDGGALLFGALLMAAFLLLDGLRVTRGGLRWGYLAIGAGAYVNVASEWLAARRDPANLAFGRIEGVGLSDPSKLVDLYGWSERRLVNSYLALAAVCLFALALVVARRWRSRSGPPPLVRVTRQRD